MSALPSPDALSVLASHAAGLRTCAALNARIPASSMVRMASDLDHANAVARQLAIAAWALANHVEAGKEAELQLAEVRTALARVGGAK